jgi:hypothetical protein
VYGVVKHRATPDFWYDYRQLPPHIPELADKCYELLKQDPYYTSLHFKKEIVGWVEERNGSTELRRTSQRQSLVKVGFRWAQPNLVS